MTTAATAGVTGSFTCASCRVIFTNVEEQRTHYQSDWHRYNLRRKVADLPPVTDAAFRQKLSSATANLTATTLADEEATRSRECIPCGKTFASAAAFDNHASSRKHRELLQRHQQKHQTAEVFRVLDKTRGETSETGRDRPSLPVLPDNPTEEQLETALKQHVETAPSRLALEDCLFCAMRFESMDMAIDHMRCMHSFYIPDMDFLVNLPGLMRYLADKLSVWHVCLACGSDARQGFPSLEAVRTHMRDKGHNKIRFDDEGSSELADFFDYSTLRQQRSSARANADESLDEDDFTTDEDAEDSEDGLFDEGALILAPDESELILPNGRRLGSRVYRHYYRQHLIPYLDTEVRPNALRPTNPPHPDGTVVRGQHYVPPPRPIDEQEKRDRRAEHKAQKALSLSIGIKANGLQHHYREQLLQ